MSNKRSAELPACLLKNFYTRLVRSHRKQRASHKRRFNLKKNSLDDLADNAALCPGLVQAGIYIYIYIDSLPVLHGKSHSTRLWLLGCSTGRTLLIVAPFTYMRISVDPIAIRSNDHGGAEGRQLKCTYPSGMRRPWYNWFEECHCIIRDSAQKTRQEVCSALAGFFFERIAREQPKKER